MLAPELRAACHDAGALIAGERGDRRFFWALHLRLVQAGAHIVVPAVVLAQAWRGGPQAALSRPLRACSLDAREEPEVPAGATEQPRVDPHAKSRKEILPGATRQPRVDPHANSRKEILVGATGQPRVDPHAKSRKEILPGAAGQPRDDPHAKNRKEILPGAAGQPRDDPHAKSREEFLPDMTEQPRGDPHAKSRKEPLPDERDRLARSELARALRIGRRRVRCGRGSAGRPRPWRV